MGGRHVCVNMWVGAGRPLGHALLNRNGTSHDPRQTGSRTALAPQKDPTRVPVPDRRRAPARRVYFQRGGGFKNIFGLTFES